MSNVSFPHARDLDNVTLVASLGQRIGPVGDNGVGTVTRPDDCGFLVQELTFRTDRHIA